MILFVMVGISVVSATDSNVSGEINTQDTITHDTTQEYDQTSNIINQETKTVEKQGEYNKISTNNSQILNKKTLNANTTKAADEPTDSNISVVNKVDPVFYLYSYNYMPRINQLDKYIVSLTTEDGTPLTGQEVSFKFNNISSPTIEENEGEYYTEYAPTSLGELNLTVTFAGNELYNPATISEILEVRKPTPEFSAYLDPNKIQVGETTEVKGMLYLPDDYSYFAGQTVTITCNDSQFTSVVSENGEFSHELSPEVGEYEVSISWNGDENYDEVSAIDQLLVASQKIVYLSAEPDYYYVSPGDLITIKGYLYDKNDTKIPNQKFIIRYDDKEDTIRSDNNGDFSYNLSFDTYGYYPVEILFETTELYYETSKFIWLDVVEQKDSVLTIDTITESNGEDIKYGSVLIVNGTLTDGDGEPIKYVEINDGNDFTYTDEYGKFSIQHEVNAVGTNNLTLYFRGDYNHKRTNATKTYESSKYDKEITVYSHSPIYINQTVDIWGRFAKNTEFIIKINNDVIDTVTTDIDGNYNYNYLITPENFGKNNVTVKFDGNEYVEASTANHTFIATKIPVYMISDEIEDTEIGSTINISGKLMWENPLPNKNITIILPEKTVNTQTDENGNFSIEYKTLYGGENYVTINYAGDEYFEELSLGKFFNVLDSRNYLYIDLNEWGNQKIGSTLEITGNVYGADISGEQIVISYNDVPYIVNVTDWQFKQNITVNKLGNNIIRASFEGNDEIRASFDSFSFMAYKGDIVHIEIVPRNMVVDVNETLVINGSLCDENNTKIPNQKFIIKNLQNDNEEIVTSDSNGDFLYEIYPEEVGDYRYQIIFEETEEYAPTSYEVVYVARIRKETIVKIQNITPNEDILYGARLEVHVTLTDSAGNKLNYSEAYMEFIDVHMPDASLIGIGLSDFIFETYVQNVGKIPLTVYYSGDENYKPSNDTIYYEADKNTPNFYIYINNDGVPAGDNISIDIYFVEGTTAKLKINNHTMDTIYFDSYNYNYEYLTTEENIGINNITLEFEGNEYYNPTSGTETFNVTNTRIIFEEIPTVTYGENVTIKGTLHNMDKTIPNANITLTILGDSFNTKTDDKGQFSLNYKPVICGSLYVRAEYAGDETNHGTRNGSYIYVPPIAEKDLEIVLINLNDSYVVGEVLNVSGIVHYYDGRTEYDEETGEYYYIDEYYPVTNTNIIIQFNGNNYTVPLDENGKFEQEIPLNEKGQFLLRLLYPGNETFNPDIRYAHVYVNKMDTQVTINPINARVGQIIDLTAIVKNNQSTVDEGNVLFKINNETLKDENGNELVVNVSNGKATTKYAIPESWFNRTNIIEAVFVESNKYYSSNTTTSNITILPKIRNTKVTINPISTTVIGNTIQISGKLTDEENNIMANARINILVNENTYNTTTNNDGIYTYNYATTTPGTNNIVVSYAGNDDYIASNSTTKFTVNKKDTTITINNINTAYYGDNIVITGTLTDITNNTIPNTNINLLINNKENIIQTDNKGKFTYNTKATIIGNNNIKISYAGNTIYNPNTANTTFNVKAKDTKITVNTINTVTLKDPITITGTLTTKDNTIIPNTDITIKINNNKVSAKTNDKGTYTYTTNADTVGTNNIQVLFEGNSYYTASNTKTTFKVNKIDTTLTVNKITDKKIDDNITITGTLKDVKSNIIAQAPITITINNDKHTVNTDKTGAYSYTTKASITGINNVTVSYEGNTNYTNTNAKTTFNVEKATDNTPTENTTKQKVKITVDPVIGIIGENITLTAHITDEKGNNVSGGNVAFKLNGKTLRTDGRFDSKEATWKLKVENGKVTITIKADLYLRNAKNLTASYSGTSIYEEAKSEIVTAQIRKRNAKLTLTLSPKKQKQYNTITFTAKLTDTTPEHKNSTAISTNTKVLFKINGVSLKDKNGKNILVKVNKNGTATYKYKIPGSMGGISKDGKTRNYNVTAILVSDTFYPDTKNSKNFNVERSPITINITKVSVNKNNKLNVQATIKDYKNNKLVGNNIVSLKINGKTYVNPKTNKTQMFTVVNGTINLKNIQVNKNITIKKVMVVTGARQAYLGGRNETSKIVKV